jgi:hypothetical protein
LFTLPKPTLMSDGAKPTTKTFDPTATAATVNARPRSESATLICAVAVAVALGIACGFWINSLMASAASAARAAPSRPTPDTRADIPPLADETRIPQGSNETADTDTARTEPAGTTVEGRALKQAAPTATPVAREASRQPKVEVSPGTTWQVEQRVSPEREQSRTPCALYASVGSLTLRGGVAAPLVLGGPGESAQVAVSTPDWSNIAVLYEGRTGNGWLRYSVRSVSGRPGIYTVRFATPCGSKTIPVTVK